MNTTELETYKLFVTMADKVSARRLKANTFFLSINSFLIALAGIMTNITLGHQSIKWVFFVSAAGIAMSLFWYHLIMSYRSLNAAKFKVIHEMEKELSIAPFDLEWKFLQGSGHTSFTSIESLIPFVFGLLYVALFTYAVIERFM